MSDKNEAIARWMGWSHTKGGCPTCTTVPAYHESLDALVPVMEALRGEHEVDVRLQNRGTFLWRADVWREQGAVFECTESQPRPAEALRDAIYAALVAMQEVTE